MPSNQITYRSVTVQQAAPGAAEVVIAQLQVTNVAANAAVQLQAVVLLTTGATTTAVVPRIRRNALAGTLVSTGTSQKIVGAAGDTSTYQDFAVDTPGEVASLLYVFTIAQTGAGGNGAVAAVLLEAVTP